MKKKRTPAIASRPRVGELADGRRLDREPVDGGEDQEDEHQLEAEHGPVAGAPHAPGHDPHQQGRGEDLGQPRLLPLTFDPAGSRPRSRAAIRAEIDRPHRDHHRPLALGQRLQRLARFLVAHLGLRVAALSSARRGRLAGRSLRLRARSATGRRARRRRRKAPRAALRRRRPGSSASRIARTTPSRRAPASTTWPAFDGSMPPIAKKGCGAFARRVRDQLEADRRAPLFGRRLPDRADADVVDGRLAGGRDLLLGVGREADDRVGPEQLARLAGRGVVLADVDAVGVAGERQVGVVVDDEEGAVGVAEAAEGRAPRARSRGGGSDFSRSWTMSTPPLSAARSSGSGSSPRGRASQTK